MSTSPSPSVTPTKSVTPTRASDYSWVTGFQDFVRLMRQYPLFTVTFIIFHSFIAYTLVGSYRGRITSYETNVCSQFKAHPNQYHNGTDWLPMPEGDLLELYNRLYPKIKSSRNVFFEDLEALAYPASLEEAKAAVQIKGEFFVHPYRAIIPCKTESTDASGLLVCSLIYIISFAAFLAYLVSPFGWLK